MASLHTAVVHIEGRAVAFRGPMLASRAGTYQSVRLGPSTCGLVDWLASQRGSDGFADGTSLMRSPGKAVLDVSCAESSISVRVPATLADRLRFLQPHFQVSERPSKAIDLDVLIGPKQWRGACAKLRSGLGYAYGGSIDSPFAVLIEGGRACRWRFVAPDASAFAAMEPTRCARALLIERLHQDGWRFLRAAAVTTPHGAVVLAGDRRSGKTSMLLRFLASGCGDLMANDKVAINSDGGTTLVRGMPLAAGVRLNALLTLTNEPGAPESLPALLKTVEAGPCELDEAGWRRVRVPLELVARTFGISVRPAAALRAVLLMHYRDSMRGFRILELDSDEGAMATERYRLRSIRELLPRQHFIADRVDREQGALLPNSIRVARVEVGRDIQQTELVSTVIAWAQR